LLKLSDSNKTYAEDKVPFNYTPKIEESKKLLQEICSDERQGASLQINDLSKLTRQFIPLIDEKQIFEFK
jgi:hypothetical protein